MPSWFSKRRDQLAAVAPKLRPRRERSARRAGDADLAAIAPALRPYLAQAAVVQLEAFEALSALVGVVPPAAREDVGAAAGRALSRHQGLVDALRRDGADPVVEQAAFAADSARFRHAVVGSPWAEHLWAETLLAAHLACGILDDTAVRLAGGIHVDAAHNAAALLSSDPAEGEPVVALLQAAIADDAALASRLALWGRRLVGDVLLIVRAGLTLSGDPDVDEPHIEHLVGEALAAHTRRMDALGLTP